MLNVQTEHLVKSWSPGHLKVLYVFVMSFQAHTIYPVSSSEEQSIKNIFFEKNILTDSRSPQNSFIERKSNLPFF